MGRGNLLVLYGNWQRHETCSFSYSEQPFPNFVQNRVNKMGNIKKAAIFCKNVSRPRKPV